jgi:hypothetical protein
MGTITAINHKQEFRIRTDTGKHVRLTVDPAAHGPRAFRHLDHGYAVTSYSSQGLTADRVVLYIDSEHAGERLVNQRLAYVALSRGRHEAHIYTDDRDRLPAALSRDVSKTSAHNVRQPPQQSPQHARLHHDHVSPRSLLTRSRTVAPSHSRQPSFGGPSTGAAPAASPPSPTRDQATAHGRTPGPATAQGHGR